MEKLSTNISQRHAALVAGIGLLLMTIFAVAAIYFIFPKLITPDNAAVTVQNILGNELLFRLGICCLIIVAILDVVVAWALYIFFIPANKNLSLLSAIFRVVYAAMLGIALFNYFNVLQLLSGAEFLMVFNAEQLQANVMLSLNAIDDGWTIGLVFFGLHLALIGYLALKSSRIPKILAVILLMAGFAYLIDSIGIILFSNYSLDIATFVGWGELLLMIWLLLKGGKVINK